MRILPIAIGGSLVMSGLSAYFCTQSKIDYKIYFKSLSIFAALGALFSLYLYVKQKNIFTSNTFSPPKKPIAQESGHMIRKNNCKKEVEKLLSPNQELGEAPDNGDCFYAALSMALAQNRLNIPVKQLRTIVWEALQTPLESERVRTIISKDTRGIDTFENYKNYVRYSKDELEAMSKQDPLVPKDSYWGAPEREGIILCHKYQFTLRVLSGGFIDSKLTSDPTYQTYSLAKEKLVETDEQTQNSLRYYDGLIQERAQTIYSNPANYFSGDDVYPKEIHYPITCTLALFDNHFVPVLNK